MLKKLLQYHRDLVEDVHYRAINLLSFDSIDFLMFLYSTDAMESICYLVCI